MADISEADNDQNQADNNPTMLTKDGNEAASKNFAARSSEQAHWSELLRSLVGPKRGLLSNLVMGNVAPKQPKVTTASKSRLLLISGSAGIGKSRLGLRLREIAQHDKEFNHRFRTTRLGWLEARERDARLRGLRSDQPVPPELFLDVISNHLEREDFSLHLEAYQQAMEETLQLSQTVTGAELEAVWEYRARALGQSLKQLAEDKPLLFFLDDCEILGSSIAWFRPIFEESGSGLVWVLLGQTKAGLGEWQAVVAPERRLEMPLTALRAVEMQRLLEIEFGRYKIRPTLVEAGEPIYKSPDQLARLTALSAGSPLAARLLVYILQSGLRLDEFEDKPGDKTVGLLTKMLEDVLSLAHPDRLKIYAFGVLRRPERGLLAALLDLRQDMLPINDLLQRINARYEFLFEPGRQMTLHSSLAQPLRQWLSEPPRRQEESGLVRINRRGLDYLNERLHEWGLTFNSLRSRISDVKWVDWALDKVWHSFWLNEDAGWREAVPIFVAALEYKPLVANQLLVMLEELSQLGMWGKTGQNHLADLKAILQTSDQLLNSPREALQNLHDWSQRENWFGQHLASNDEFERILAKLEN